jgi:hypothetical protein
MVLEDVRRELTLSCSVLHALDIIWTKPVKVRVQILTLWWLWWCNRNKLREGEKTLDAEVIAHRGHCNAAEYLEVLGKKNKGDKPLVQTSWMPPEPDVLKINIDGAFTPRHDHAGWGVVVP